MKHRFVLYATVACACQASAALPPVYQNAKDLDVMVAFVQQHRVVMESLRTIDLQNKTVHFGADCTARFDRAPRASPRPGPAAALEFRDATCAVGPAAASRGN